MADSPDDRPTIDALTARLDALVRHFEAHPDPLVRDRVLDLLRLVDALHRPAIEQMAAALDQAAPDVLRGLLAAGPVRTVLDLYEVLALDDRTRADLALDSVRGLLGGDRDAVQVLTVAGGEVHVRLGDTTRCQLPADRLRRLIEDALRGALPEFTSLVVHATTTGARMLPLSAHGPAPGASR